MFIFSRSSLRVGTRTPTLHLSLASHGPQCGEMTVPGVSRLRYALPNAHPSSAPRKHAPSIASTAASAAGNASQLCLSRTPLRHRYTALHSPPLRTAGSKGANESPSLRGLRSAIALRSSSALIAGAAASSFAISRQIGAQ